MTTRQIPPVLVKPLPRTSLMAPNFHSFTNPKKKLRLFFGVALNFGKYFRVLEIHRTVTPVVEMLSDARIVLTATNVTSVFLHPLILPTNGVPDIRIFRRRVAGTVKLVDNAFIRRFVTILPAEDVF